MRFLKGLTNFLSGDWWKGLAVIASAFGIVVGSILTYGIFRLTESNVDLARSRETPNVAVTAAAYIPVIEGVPQYEGKWLANLSIVNYGPASATGFHVDTSFNFQLAVAPDSIRIFDSSLGEVTNSLLASATYGEGPHQRGLTVDVTVLRPGETLDIVIEASPGENLSRYARSLQEGHSLHPLAGALPLVPSGSLSGYPLDVCVFYYLDYRGNGNVSLHPEALGYGDVAPYSCP